MEEGRVSFRMEACLFSVLTRESEVLKKQGVNFSRGAVGGGEPIYIYTPDPGFGTPQRVHFTLWGCRAHAYPMRGRPSVAPRAKLCARICALWATGRAYIAHVYVDTRV